MPSAGETMSNTADVHTLILTAVQLLLFWLTEKKSMNPKIYPFRDETSPVPGKQFAQL